MQTLMSVGLSAVLWSFFHSLFITHRWQNWQDRAFSRLVPWSRLLYVIFNTVSLAWLLMWWRTLPQATLFDWPGAWQILRWAGLFAAFVFFTLGAAAYDNRAFLGLRQVANHLKGRQGGEPEFSRQGILGKVRHPWYSGTILFFVFCLPVTDINLVWRTVFVIYTLVGTELEERKLRKELGDKYADYSKEVGRFF